MALDDPAEVSREYASERGLEGRRAAYRWATGPDAVEVAFDAVVEVAPTRVLEVGCGPGELAARIQEHVGPPVRALDISPRMVELARGRGVDAQVGDVQSLPFEDASFDVVLAAWMLYHVPDLAEALDEVGRVLRPGGRLVAVTNGSAHLQELRQLIGVASEGNPFDETVAGPLLSERFAFWELRDASGTIVFPDRESVLDYVNASPTLLRGTGAVPAFEVPFVVTRAALAYAATKR